MVTIYIIIFVLLIYAFWWLGGGGPKQDKKEKLLEVIGSIIPGRASKPIMDEATDKLGVKGYKHVPRPWKGPIHVFYLWCKNGRGWIWHIITRFGLALPIIVDLVDDNLIDFIPTKHESEVVVILLILSVLVPLYGFVRYEVPDH